MAGRHLERVCGTSCPRLRALFALVVLVLFACSSAACGSAGPGAAASSTSLRTAITEVLPKDGSVEPPWNGRFVQVNVRAEKPTAMRAGDWHVFVNGKQPKLDKAPDILPFSPHEAVVAFVFQAPYTQLGSYAIRVVYAPDGGQKVQRAWTYSW